MAHQRLTKARSQYESLLLTAKGMETDILPGKLSTSSTSARLTTKLTPTYAPTPAIRARPSVAHNVESDGEDLVLYLQEEIDRLKAKVNSIINDAENTYKEFQANEVSKKCMTQ